MTIIIILCFLVIIYAFLQAKGKPECEHDWSMWQVGPLYERRHCHQCGHTETKTL